MRNEAERISAPPTPILYIHHLSVTHHTHHTHHTAHRPPSNPLSRVGIDSMQQSACGVD